MAPVLGKSVLIQKDMAHLIIRNIGPIKEVDIELNKINVIMGPQSSGKSTINKIACYCSWVEKKVSLDKSFDFFLKDATFVMELVRFHKLKGYFKPDSYIEYESKVVKFTYDHNLEIPEMEWKDSNAFKRAKISYIPSERNIVAVVPNWMEVKLVDNNTRSFMVDWSAARKSYTIVNPLNVLNLGVKYYYDESSDKDFVILENQGKLELTDTSSGLQSIIPLVILLDYLTVWIYSKEVPNSVENIIKKEIIINTVIKDYINTNMPEAKDSSDIEKLIFFALSKHKDISSSGFDPLIESIENYSKNHWTNLFIEEPEQNLFPSSQRDLMYFLLQTINGNKDHKLFLTTHSPYILYALNNCMLGHLVKDNMPEDEAKELLCYPAWIDPQKVSVWEIEDGRLRNIQDKDNIVSENYFDQQMTKLTNEYYQMLNYYEDEE